MRTTLSLAALVAGSLLSSPASAAQTGAADGEWRTYGGDLGSTKYSPLDQIHGGNLDQVEVAWTWSTPDELITTSNPELEVGGFKATPLMVDGVLYIRTSLSMVAALDAVSGQQIWLFDPGSYTMGRPTNLGFNSRGVSYWEDGDDRRIYLATGDSHLWALDAATGEPIESFGERGRIDLTEGLRRPVPRQSYQVMSPPLVIRDVVVVGSSISDGPRYMTAPPGDVRAFDARTGELRWNFKTVPQPGEVGHDTWENDGWEYTGNTNVWTMMSADEELGLVYLPTGTPTNDWYGGHRIGDNLFAETLVAVDASTGERRWHYQLVHHGVWDYDIPAAPTLVDVTVDGRPVRAVAQVTKQGFTYVFDRATGEPIWPIVERPVAQSTIPGERLSPTQPFPTRPPAFERQGLAKDDLIDFTPELRAEAEAILAQSEHGGLFHPPTLKGTINLPGWGGGANWHGAGVDPETGVLYVPSRTSPMQVQLTEGDPSRSDFRYVRGAGRTVSGPGGFPLVKPPYARITAIDLNQGEHVWQVPLGDGPRQRVVDLGLPDPGPLGGGGYTGPLVTSSLLFIGHSGPRGGDPDAPPAILGIDKASGAVVGEVPLPAAATGTPMTYSAFGRQYIVVAVSGPAGTGLVGLAIP